MPLTNFFSMGEAITQFFYPHVEIVIHDLTTGNISAIFNTFSKRKVGDESSLEELKDFAELPSIFPPYFKTNWDGRRLKSVSVLLKNTKGKAIGLFCMNVDLSKWEEIQSFVSSFIQPTQEKQDDFLFKNDWRERINRYVTSFLNKEGITLKSVSKEKKKELVCKLHHEGGFEAKNAAAYVADILELSRATVYKYLKEKL